MSELHQAGSGDALLSVRGLKTYFPVYGGLFATKQGYVQAVNNVSFDVHCGETLGLWAKVVAAKARWRRQFCASCLRPPARSILRDAIFSIFRGRNFASCAKRYKSFFRIRFPRWTLA